MRDRIDQAQHRLEELQLSPFDLLSWPALLDLCVATAPLMGIGGLSGPRPELQRLIREAAERKATMLDDEGSRNGYYRHFLEHVLANP
jgi:hypothetical protein